MFLFLLFLHFHSCSSFFPVPLFHLLLSLLSLFSFSLGDDTKWPTRVDVSLNPNTISYDCIYTIYQCIKSFLDNKLSIFEEYGVFKHTVVQLQSCYSRLVHFLREVPESGYIPDFRRSRYFLVSLFFFKRNFYTSLHYLHCTKLFIITFLSSWYEINLVEREVSHQIIIILCHLEGWAQDWRKSDGCFSPNLIFSPLRRYEDYNISFCKQWKFSCHCSYEPWHLNLHCLQRGPSCS